MLRLRLAPLAAAFALAALAGCDQLGIESATQLAAKREADGKAVGGACRHAGRAIEDCYTLNRKADKSSVYAGWREMDDYMRENKLEAVPAQLTPSAVAAAKPAADGEDTGDDAATPDKKGGAAKAPAKPGAKPGQGGSAKHAS